MANHTSDDISDSGDSSSSGGKEHYRDEGFTTAESKELLRDYLYNTVSGGTIHRIKIICQFMDLEGTIHGE